MITFNTPCLRWKLVLAQKLQIGWPGFIAPYRTRYLSKHVVLSYVYDNGAGTTSYEMDITLDRLSGAATVNDHSGGFLSHYSSDFPYTEPLTEDPVTSEKWDVSETHFTHSYHVGGGYTVVLDVTLSDQYDIGQLDADLDALLAAVNVAAMPWNTLQSAIGGTGLSDPSNAIPAQWNYAGLFNTSPVTIPLRAAAYSAWTPGLVTADSWFPNESVKVIGWIAMAGNYCLNTFTLDANQNLLNQTCQSGVGSCAAPFEVTPPPLSETTNAYVVLTPNCKC